eukprot:TRINITY_DN32150_c0_g1_i1.p1 TRINITY_DN32150_c0_g1~~TRINITY_DN32150_c0_g1_i1.p1  ORF type:complete len:141 (-),score=9.26 TRINITY_DN32150_c0_g1_i1:163-552(-)
MSGHCWPWWPALAIFSYMRLVSSSSAGDVIPRANSSAGSGWLQVHDGESRPIKILNNLMFTISDDYPYSCKCVQKSNSDGEFGVCQNDPDVLCNIITDTSDSCRTCGTLFWDVARAGTGLIVLLAAAMG